MILDKDTLYMLENAAARLQRQADACRGTVCDDYKTYGLQKEADAIRRVIEIMTRATSR